MQTFTYKIAGYFKIVEDTATTEGKQLMEFEKLLEDAANEKKKKTDNVSNNVVSRFISTVNKAEAEAVAKAANVVEKTTDKVTNATKQKLNKVTGAAAMQTANEELKILEDRATKVTIPI